MFAPIAAVFGALARLSLTASIDRLAAHFETASDQIETRLAGHEKAPATCSTRATE